MNTSALASFLVRHVLRPARSVFSDEKKLYRRIVPDVAGSAHAADDAAVRINPLPDARTALSRIDHWMEDYNSEHPHSRLGYRSPREYIALLKPAACPV
jgi:transposase InsO family protein